MRICRSALLLAALTVPVDSFAPTTSLTKRSVPIRSNIEQKAVPTSVTVDLPSWLVEASQSSVASVKDLNIPQQLQLDQLYNSIQESLVQLGGPLQNVPGVSSILDLSSSTPSWLAVTAAAFSLTSVLVFFILNLPSEQTEAPYEPGTSTYNPEKAAQFYSKRPLLVLQRVLKLAFLTSTFNAGLLFDWLVLGKLLRDEEYTALRRNEPQRAKQALKLCEQLGPTFIKLGQALSIRTDLIPEPYALELRQLQDAVPPFDSATAYQVMQDQFGVTDLSTIFQTLSSQPVASASIGQVYRGTLQANNKDVAVKVQRPGILAEIALDLHVLRILTPIQTTLQNLANGLQTSPKDIQTAVSLVDEWGRGFVAETDYQLEAENTKQFQQAMQARGLDAVTAPQVVDSLVTDKVLVTEWMDGTRLDLDASPDVPRLCGVAINAYLTMLLDTGVLHCDPHPGNLLRTTDGKLCILDWGMTLQVPPNLQYALLELIAHINIEDYNAIPQDFINLGFSPKGVTAERLQSSGITEGLTFTFRQLSQGGGPKKIQQRVKAEFQQRYGAELSDTELRSAARAEMLERMEAQLESEGVDVKGVTNVMEEMSRRNRELFALPPYILYVARAFSTLEGIGLSVDENYAIVQECYPYLARRLFTDRSPRAKKALRAMLGLAEQEEEANGVNGEMQGVSPSSALAVVQAGARGESTNGAVSSKNTLSPSKLIEMSEGFASYTAATAEVDRDGAGQSAAVKEFAKLFLDPQGSTLQDILVDETARVGDAATRAALRASLVESPAAKAAAAALRAPKEILEQSPVSNLLPKGLKAAFIDRPAEFPELINSLVSSNDEDERILASARELRNAIGSRVSNGNNGDSAGPPSNVNLDAVTSLLADEETRKTVTEQLPGVAALGRRVGAGLLRRAAYRTEKSHIIPEQTRKAISEANNALADALDVGGSTTTKTTTPVDE